MHVYIFTNREQNHMKKQHKVYVSCHSNDQVYWSYFKDLFSNTYEIIVSDSIRMRDFRMGDYDDKKISTEKVRRHIRDKYLQDTTVTVVLVGANTWQQESVDWEINASIHQTEFYTRSGLLGIFLQTYTCPPDKPYNPRTIPPRLYDNIRCGYCEIYPWNENPHMLQDLIHNAYKRRIEVRPNNSRPPLRNSLSKV